MRFFLVATCIFFFGPSVKSLMERYFEVATLVLFLAVVAGFVAIKYLL